MFVQRAREGAMTSSGPLSGEVSGELGGGPVAGGLVKFFDGPAWGGGVGECFGVGVEQRKRVSRKNDFVPAILSGHGRLYDWGYQVCMWLAIGVSVENPVEDEACVVL